MIADRPAVYLHIGAMKTGTTYLQGKLSENRAALHRAGFLVPGQDWAHRVWAAEDAVRVHWDDPAVRERRRGAWQAMADEMLAHRASAVFSMEFLSFARPWQAGRIVDSLAGADVSVVLTVRDTAAVIPSQWQTTVRSGARISWPDHLRGVRQAGTVRARRRRTQPPALRSFLRAADIPRMLQVWGEVVPRERLHVVTVRPSRTDPDLLWRRFAEAIGLDPALPTTPSPKVYGSLGFASTELLRQVNEKLGRPRRTDYVGTVKNVLAREILATRRGQETRVGLDDRTREFAAAWNRRVRKAIMRSGVHVVEDLDDLPRSPSSAPAGFRSEPEQAEILEAAAVAVEGMDRLVRHRLRQRRARGEDLPIRLGRPLVASPDRWALAPDPVGAATDEIAALCLVAMEHRRQLAPGKPQVASARAGIRWPESMR